jgi:hypothetical protein
MYTGKTEMTKLDMQRQIRGRLYDLIADLDRNEQTKQNAQQMREALKQVKTQRLLKELRDPSSALSKSIPEDILAQHENGKAYLDIIGMLREKKNTGPSSTNPINSLQGLVESITNELDLENGGQLDPSNIGDLLARITQSVQQKHEAGLLDANTLEQDAQTFLTTMESNPMFQQILSNPQVMSLVQNLDQSTDQAAP